MKTAVTSKATALKDTVDLRFHRAGFFLFVNVDITSIG